MKPILNQLPTVSVRYTILLICLLFLSSIGFAQDSLNVSKVSELTYWDSAFDLVNRGTSSAIATGSTGVVFTELRNDTIIQTITISTLGSANNLALSGDILAIAEDVNGIELYRWNETGSVTLLSHILLPQTQPTSIAIRDTLLFIGTLEGIYSYSISNPEQPIALGQQIFNAVVRSISIRDTIAVLSVSAPGLRILNIADPVGLPTLGTLESTSAVMGTDWIDSVRIICAETNRVRTVSLVNPASPQVLGQATMLGSATSVTVRDTVAYVSSQSAGLRIVGLANPETPTILGGALTQSGARKTVLNDHFAFVADGQYGLSIVDITSPTTPLLSASYDPPSRIEAITKIGNYAYLGSFGKGLRVVDVFDRAAPYEATNLLPTQYPLDLTTQGDYCYALTSYRDRALQILDVANPRNPQILGSFPMSSDAYGFDAKDNYGFLAYGTYGIRLLSIPTNPSLVRSIDTIGFAKDIKIVDSIAFIATDGGELLVWNVVNPLQPREIFTYSFTGHPQSVLVSGQFCFVVDSDSGIRIFSADPTERQQIATIPITNLLSIAVSGYHVFAACGYDGLKVYSMHNPFEPRLVGYYNTRGAALEVAVADGFAYVADRSSLCILDCNVAVSAPENEEVNPLPNRYDLLSVYPNPFNATAAISYTLPAAAQVHLRLFNANGQEIETIAKGYRRAGTHMVTVNGNQLSAGTYFVAAQLGKESVVKKIVLLK